jgi:hypothetical protein
MGYQPRSSGIDRPPPPWPARGWNRAPVRPPPPLAWYYVCDPMILLALIAGAVMVPIVLIVAVAG